MNFQETPEWQLGEVAASLVREWLRTTGWWVLPVDHIAMDGAPRFLGPNGAGLVTPDIAAMKSGEMRWIEVKWKTSCVLHQRTRTWRHGVDIYNWEDYLAIERTTGSSGWLAIVQGFPGPNAEEEPTLLVASFGHLAEKFAPHEGTGAAKAWWDVDEFRWCPLEEVGPIADEWRALISDDRLVRPWEQPSKAGIAPRWTPVPSRRFYIRRDSAA